MLQNTALSAALKLNYDLAGNLAAVQAGTSGVPVILAQPFVQIDEDNRNVVSLSVNVVSDTPATCQWQLNGQNIVGATSATLLLQNMTAADSGSYTVVITNATGNVTSTATILSFGLPPNIPVNFEYGLVDWTVDGGTWEVGAPTSGPNAAHSGAKCAATVLGGNYSEPNGNTGRSLNTRLMSPLFIVPDAAQNPRLRFWQWYSFNVGPDYGEVQIKVGAGAWQPLSGDYMQTGGNVWTRASLDLSAYAGQTVQVGFFFHAQDDSSTTPEVAPGWYVDEVTLVTGPVATLTPNVAESFEAGPGDWYVDGGTWETGAPTSGQNAAHSGTKCAATVLAGNYSEPNGDSGQSVNTRLVSPCFTVPAAVQNPRLRFWHWYSFNVGPDYGEVQIKVGSGTWQALSGDYLQTGGNVWTRTSLDLSAYAGQTVQVGFFFHAQDDSSITPEVAPGWYVDEVTLVTGAFTLLTPNVAESFESGLGDWYVDGGTWETGAPTSGPNAAHSGTKCAATVLAGNYSEPNGNSGQSVNTRLTSPPFTVPDAAQNPRLRFWQWYSFNVGPDYGKVQIRVGAGAWQALSGDYLQTGGNVWTRTSLDLSAYAGQTVQIGFFFHAQDDSGTTPEVAPGWYVDEVTLVTGPFAPLTPNVAESFEGGLGDWYVDGGTWETGTPTSGPNAAHSGTKCAATVLAGNYYEPNGSSGQSVNTRLTSPPFTVPVAGQNPRLRFWQWYSFNVGPDYGEVQIRVGTGAWQALSGDYLQTGGNMWTHASLDLSAYAGQIVQIGFFFHAQDDSGTTPEVAPGWYLDEVALVTGAFTTVVYTDSVLAWWPGEGSALDAAGTHHGTLQGGAAYASGKVGQAFSLNGSTSMVQIPDSPDWAFGSADFSIELWANFSVSTGSRAFVASDQGSGNQNKWIFWLDGGVLRFHINGSAGSASIGSAGFVPTLNQWYHLAITRSSSSYTFYVNGSSVSANVDGRSVPNANAPLTIGSAEGAFFFNGRLDEVSIYNRTLSDGEIAAINAAGATGKVFTPGQIWRKSYFGATSNTGVAADTADPDFDGLANLLEFATNSIPTLSSSQPGQAVRNSSNLEFIYTRNKAAMSGGITFAVEWSDTLPGTSWSSTGVTQQVLSDNGTVQQVKATLPVGSAGRRFVHLKVTGP